MSVGCSIPALCLIGDICDFRTAGHSILRLKYRWEKVQDFTLVPHLALKWQARCGRLQFSFVRFLDVGTESVRAWLLVRRCLYFVWGAPQLWDVGVISGLPSPHPSVSCLRICLFCWIFNKAIELKATTLERERTLEKCENIIFWGNVFFLSKLANSRRVLLSHLPSLGIGSRFPNATLSFLHWVLNIWYYISF